MNFIYWRVDIPEWKQLCCRQHTGFPHLRLDGAEVVGFGPAVVIEACLLSMPSRLGRRLRLTSGAEWLCTCTYPTQSRWVWIPLTSRYCSWIPNTESSKGRKLFGYEDMVCWYWYTCIIIFLVVATTTTITIVAFLPFNTLYLSG